MPNYKEIVSLYSNEHPIELFFVYNNCRNLCYNNLAELNSKVSWKSERVAHAKYLFFFSPLLSESVYKQDCSLPFVKLSNVRKKRVRETGSKNKHSKNEFHMLFHILCVHLRRLHISMIWRLHFPVFVCLLGAIISPFEHDHGSPEINFDRRGVNLWEKLPIYRLSFGVWRAVLLKELYYGTANGKHIAYTRMENQPLCVSIIRIGIFKQ